ncbi:hypothetical protein IEU95_14750 [Hoyosella rhizosphaerae]|uniref:Uncharacterized protein n=1 Tax=Hoyosella rhizosphaerae TaxID=1755582 RepID=A0A916UH32_9ACTN|nr:hypothetical protein [Hoyosella rhizosphaerae]MBN4928098.1 hypothetical protein [Hoyosella rhizosphaerae]GGC72383.1 hypothetical protein GCM10011410_26780 [Hoyosella rhizosphaerae]
MDIVIGLILALHILGVVALLGGVLYQMKAMKAGEAKFIPGMLHGAFTMLITGILLVGLNEMADYDLNHIKIGVKTLVLLVITALVYINRDAPKVSNAIFGAVGGLTVVNILLATMW